MSNLVSPQLVPSDIMAFAENNVKKALAVGASKLNIHIPFEGVQFFKKSRTAGYVQPMTSSLVYLNLELVKQNRQHFEKDTIPHEVAHLFARKLQVLKNLPVEGAHGKTWKMVMRRVYGLEPTRCHSLDTSGIGKCVSRFRYICNCRKHEFTAIRHNKVQSGKQSYRCGSCKSRLTFLSKID
jgi:SprT protein